MSDEEKVRVEAANLLNKALGCYGWHYADPAIFAKLVDAVRKARSLRIEAAIYDQKARQLVATATEQIKQLKTNANPI